MKFAANPRALLLAISPANNDISNSESLKFCRQVDPSGQRTICVITKADLFDGSPEQLQRLLCNELVPLRHGCVLIAHLAKQSAAVLERLQEKCSALRVKDQFGRITLLTKVQQLLDAQLAPALATLAHNVQAQLRKLEQSQTSDAALGQLSRASDKRAFFLHLVSDYVRRARDFLTGRIFDAEMGLQGAAVINTMVESYRHGVSQAWVDDLYSDAELLIAVKNANGFRPTLYVCQEAFETLAAHAIRCLLMPSIEFAERVASELSRLFGRVDLENLRALPLLAREITGVIEQLVAQRLEPTKEFIRGFFEIESGYINTKHPDFLTGATSALSSPETTPPVGPAEASARELNQIELIRKMLGAYLAVVKKNLCDYIPKVVLTLLVEKTVANCEQELIMKLLLPDRLDELMMLSPEANARTREMMNQIDGLRAVANLLRRQN